MNNKWMTHASWAAAVLLAFGLGSRRSGGESSEETAHGKRLHEESAAAAFSKPGAPASDKTALAASRSISAVEGVFGSVNYASGDLNALAQQALRDRNPITRRLAFARLLESLTPENAASIREQLVALGAEPDQWRDFHYSWGALDGKAALASAVKSPQPDLGATVTGMAAANPAEAMALLANLPAEMAHQRDELTASVVTGLSHNDPSVAADYVMRLGQEGNAKAGALMENVANETVRQLGHEGASRWAESLADGPLKGNAMAKVAETYARRDPEAAARWAAGFADKDYASRTIEQVGARWGDANPTAAAGWLESLPPSTGQKQGLSSVFGNWEDRDPVAAGDYLQAMPKSPQRDAAISGFATGYAWQDPQTAIAWAQVITDPALRESSLTRAGHAYYRRDPNGALAWMSQTGLPEATRQKIMTDERRR